ncbi:MAG: HD domain-containing protein [Erysipelothrix sp.]|nr:HD domain-containing protein [Erysipelothrix sp.]
MTVLLNVTVIMLITIIMFLLFGVFQLVNHLPPNIITSLKIISSADVLHETLPVINPYYSEAKKIKEDITRYHHERWDGLGYPYGLRGFEIPLVARIVAVADVFDALSSKRSYKPAFSFEESLQIIKNASESQLDPFIVEVFFEESPQLRSIYNSFN